MNNIKLNGYFIDIGRSEYNTWGRINGEWRSNSTFSIDINKKVILEYDHLKEVDGICSDETPDDINYKPIGERVGNNGNNKFNTIVFSSFSMGKGLYRCSNGSMVKMITKGLLLPGGAGISINADNEKDSSFKECSNLFFNHMINIKSKLNNSNAIAIGDKNFDHCGPDEMFGISKDGLDLLQQDPIKFISSHCKDSNEEYQALKKYILKMYSIFNILTWTSEVYFKQYPSLILLIAKVYKDLNASHNNQVSLDYYLTLPTDLSGVNTILISNWFKSCNGLFKQDHQFKQPSSIIFLATNFNEELYDTAIMNNRLYDEIASCPFSTLNIANGNSSLDLCKSLFNTDSIDLIKSKSIISLWINNYNNCVEPGENKTNNFVNESFVKKISDITKSNQMMGILLWCDRCSCATGPDIIPPSKITFDDSISNYYSNDNTNLIKEYLSKSNK